MSLRMVETARHGRAPVLIRVHAHGPLELAETVEVAELYATRETWTGGDEVNGGGLSPTAVSVGRLKDRVWGGGGEWRDHGDRVLVETTTRNGPTGPELVSVAALLDPISAREMAAELLAAAAAAEAHAAEQAARRDAGA